MYACKNVVYCKICRS